MKNNEFLDYNSANIGEVSSDEYKNIEEMAMLHNYDFKISRMIITAPTDVHRVFHYHNTYEIYYLYSGDRYYFVNNKTYRIKRGDLVLIKSFDIHSTQNYASSGYNRTLINFRKAFISNVLPGSVTNELLRIFDGDVHIISLDFSEQAVIEALLASMLNEQKSAKYKYEDYLRTALIQLLILASRYIENGKCASQSYYDETHKTISDVAAYINNNYAEEISLKRMANKFFISSCYLSRTFKRFTGIPFTDYLNGIRIKESERLIKFSDLSMSDIAFSVGFKSITQFGRVFKKIVGVAPSEYKRQHKKR